MSQPIFAKCENFGCDQWAEAPFPCCDSACGYEYKEDKHTFQNFQDGIVKWNDPIWSVKNWTINKLEYYAR